MAFEVGQTLISSQSPDHAPQDISTRYEIPSPQVFTTFNALKDRIKHHYELCSEYYYSLWGEHIHHGYFLDDSDTKEVAQVRLIDLLLEISRLSAGSTVLDVGCGIGGTARYLAKNHGCTVVGLTISGRQVEIAKKLTMEEASSERETGDKNEFIRVNNGKVRYVEMDAETMGEYFSNVPNKSTFNCVWISEAMSHLPDKKLFFHNASTLLNAEGKLVVADWFKASDLTNTESDTDIKPIEDGMLLPPLCTQSDYVDLAKEFGFRVLSEPLDISKRVSKTWDISWSLIQSPALWSFAFSQGRDGIAFLQAFRAMRRGYSNGTFCYAVMVFQKA